MTIDVEALKARVDLTALVGSYVKLEKAGKEWKGLCPFHDDHHASFFVAPTKGFTHCFSCGANHDAISFIQEIQGVGFTEAVAFLDSNPPLNPQLSKPARPPLPDRITSKPPADAGKPKMWMKGLGEPSRVWEYKDTDGGTLGYVARYETDEGKEIRCFAWGARGKEAPQWGCGHFSKPRPLYRLDQITARGADPVLITEGEKACDAAQALLGGYVCCTWPGGAQAWKHADLNPLAGRTVLLWPDNDDPGIKAMQGIAAVLADPQGLACKVRIIDPSGSPEIGEGDDAADWTGTTEELIAWAKPRASDYVHKSVEISTPVSTESAPQPPKAPFPAQPAAEEVAGADPESSAAQTSLAVSPLLAATAPALDPSEAATEPLGDDQPPPYADIPPPEGSTPERPPRKRKPALSVVEGSTVRDLDPQAEILPLSLSDDGIALEFAALHESNFRYVAKTDSWYAWDGFRWEMEENRASVWTAARELARELKYRPDANQLTGEGKKKLESYRNIAAFLNLVRVDKRIVASPDQFDCDPYLLGIPAGVWDLQAGKEIEPEREQYISKQAAIRPEPGDCPHWMDVLHRQTKGDSTLEQYIQRWCFYILTGSVQEQCFMAVFGPGASGKSTFVHVLGDILGDYAQAANMEAFMSRDRPEHSTELARMSGARLITATETEEGARLNEARIKVLTGNDRISARFMRQDQFDFTPSAKIILAGNHRPSLKSVGEEMRRRVHLIEFPDTIPEDERQRNLPDLLKAEYPQILYWMLQGRDWLDMGLGRPESVAHSTDQYLENEDTMGAWLAERIERKSDDNRERTKDVYADYNAWCTGTGEHAVSQKRFAQQLESRGFGRSRPGGVRHFTGLRLKFRADDRDPPPHWERD